MRFEVHVDSTVLRKLARRLEKLGIEGTEAELIEYALAHAVTSDDGTKDPENSKTSTTLMLLVGKIMVRRLEDPAAP